MYIGAANARLGYYLSSGEMGFQRQAAGPTYSPEGPRAPLGAELLCWWLYSGSHGAAPHPARYWEDHNSRSMPKQLLPSA